MKLGVIADTHLSQPSQELEELMAGPFKDAAMILHAGDITEISVLDAFRTKEVVAVCGNMDSPGFRRQWPSQYTFQAGKFRIGLIHGWGKPQGIEERIQREFERVDCIVYGHTHFPSRNTRDGVLFFNPGAFHGVYSTPGSRSIGLLYLGEAVTGEIIHL
jgi:putative phosphoesterase